jgi:CO/xanthine dehydrogenase FAD-binding subunit
MSVNSDKSVREAKHVSIGYYPSASVGDALQFLAYHPGYTLLAGGTDLVPRMNLRLMKDLKGLVYLGDIAEMKRIDNHNDHVFVGALVTHTIISASDLIIEKAPNVWYASRNMGTPAVRNVGTIGGNLISASPGGDSCVALLAADASLLIKSRHEDKIVDLKEFFLGKGKTVLQPGEILYGIRLPKPSNNTHKGSSYQRIGTLKGSSTAITNVAVEMDLDGEGICQASRIAVGAMAPTPLRLSRLEDFLAGKKMDRVLIEQAVSGIDAWINPIDDTYATAWYRRRVARVLVRRALLEASGLVDSAEEV